MKPAKNYQAPDSATAAADGDEPSKRKAVSKRLFLAANGNEVDKIEEASGARYLLLSPSGNKALDYQYGQNPAVDKMFAAFGFHTKIGNVANTVLNDKDEPGTPDDAAKEAAEWLAQLATSDGKWAERTTGGVGARIDKDALAGAIVEVAGAAGKTADYAKIRDRLESDPQYVRAARQVPDVATAYATRVGKATKSIDELL